MNDYPDKELVEWAKANRVKSKLNEATNDWASWMMRDGEPITASGKRLIESVYALRAKVEGREMGGAR